MARPSPSQFPLGQLQALRMQPVKILLEKEKSQVIEVSMVSDSRVRKVIKRYSSLLDTDGYYREDYGRICNEISIMKNSSHPHVMKIDFAIHSQSDNSLLICMPLCSTGTLSDQIHAGLDAYQIGVYFIEIACGLRYLHDKRFIHGDVKPGNVFVNASNNAILADFGSSFILPAGQDYVTTWGGTRGYIGPEFVNSHTPVNAFKMDAYSLGATLWVMLFRRNPRGRNILEDSESEHVAQIHSVLLKALLAKQAASRMSVHRVLNNLARNDHKLKILIDSL